MVIGRLQKRKSSRQRSDPVSKLIDTRTKSILGLDPAESSQSNLVGVDRTVEEKSLNAIEFELLGVDGHPKKLRLGGTALRVSYGYFVGHIPYARIAFVGTGYSAAYWPTLFAMALGIYSLYQGAIKGNTMFAALSLFGCFLIFWLTYLGNKNKFLGRTYLAVKHDAGEEQFVSTSIDVSIDAFVNELMKRLGRSDHHD